MLDVDDRLHPWDARDDWFESYWFAFHVPEQGLSVYIYPWFRPHLGLWGGGVLAWDGKGAEPWTMVHNDYAWARRFAGEASMVDETGISTPQGIRIDCLEAAQRYRIRYDRPGMAFDVTFEATGPASRTAATVSEQGMFKGHIDQPGRYTGRVRVGEQWLDVDCHCVRDRSWGPRGDDVTTMHVGYYHATASAEDAFLIVAHAGDDPDSLSLLSGYLIRDGVQAPLVAASARLVRNDALCPQTCAIEATDAQGRTLRAQGQGINPIALHVQPGMFNWSNLARWDFNDITAYGELQDTWHPDKYRAFAREKA